MRLWFELVGIDIHHSWLAGRGKHLIVILKESRAADRSGKHQQVIAPLQFSIESIEAALVEQLIAIGEPDPVGLCGLCRKIATDAASEELFLRKRLPVPRDIGRCLLVKELQ